MNKDAPHTRQDAGVRTLSVARGAAFVIDIPGSRLDPARRGGHPGID
jgi:hypothetical protein